MSDIDFTRSISDHCEHFRYMITHKHQNHIVYPHELVNNPPQNHFVDINEMVLTPSHNIVQSDKMVQIQYNHIANLRNMVILCDHFKLEGAASA